MNTYNRRNSHDSARFVPVQCLYVTGVMLLPIKTRTLHHIMAAVLVRTKESQIALLLLYITLVQKKGRIRGQDREPRNFAEYYY